MSVSEYPPSADIDTSRPSIARAYDAMLDGKDNYEVDRQLVTQVRQRYPGMYTVTQDNRQWLIRVVRYLAHTAGIDQFIDCGSGLPTAENTHEAVQRINNHAEVVYIDNDPVVLAHGRALLEENERTHFAACDFRNDDELLNDPVVTRYIDFTRPIGFLQVGSLHHVADSVDPAALMRRYIDALVPGSFVAISHFCDHTEDAELSAIASDLESVLAGDLESGRFRTVPEIADLFGDLPLIEPGIVPVAEWWPDGPMAAPLDPEQKLVMGGVARKS